MSSMNIKKILLFSLLIIIIPYFIVTIFIRDDNVKFKYISNKSVRVYREKQGIVDIVPLEEYVYRVTASEMPATFEVEALKAQAVASRTYVVYQMTKNKNKDYDVYDSENSQVYNDEEKLKEKWQNNYTKYSNRIKKVVAKTIGECIFYDNKVIDALFFSTSSGYTENSEAVFSEKLPYLRSVESTWDKLSPVYASEKVLLKQDFCSLLNINCDSITIDVVSKTDTGKINKIKINNKEFDSKEIKNILGLKSNCFEILEQDNNIVIKIKGYGHGVGMSQYGANGMALDGYNYKDIIKYYYTDVEIKKL